LISRYIANSLRQTLGRLEYCMEIVILHQLGPTVFQNLWMQKSILELGTYPLHTLFRLIKRTCNLLSPIISVSTEFYPGERQIFIQT